MSRYAIIDKDGVVINVIVATEKYIQNLKDRGLLIEDYIETFKDNSEKKTYAGIGDTYSSEKDIFIKPQPFDSWILDEKNDWKAPKDEPSDKSKEYYWDKKTDDWKIIDRSKFLEAEVIDTIPVDIKKP